MYLYAFDLSMGSTGLTIFNEHTKEPIVVTSFVTSNKRTHGQRLMDLALMIEPLVISYRPHIVVIERGFTQFNTATQVLYRVHGLINYLFSNCEQIYYTPKSIKEAIVKGNATKKQVQEAIKSKYPSVRFANEDESDSFAIGLTYFIKHHKIEWDK